jgi:murein DD-endopeptidase MepM/ murein hydrolase activator NlpD
MRQAAAIVVLAAAAAACRHVEAPAHVSTHADIILPNEQQIVEAVVPPHATLASLLRQHDVSDDLIPAVVRSAAGVFNLRQIRADRSYRLVQSIDGLLREFEYEIDADRFLRIVNTDAGEPTALEAEVVPYEKDTSIASISGAIDADHSSLIAAIDGGGERVPLALAVAGIFSGQIDFDSDLQQGDSFEVLFEKQTREGEFAGYGDVLGARFTAGGEDHYAVRWENPDTGKAGYYDEQGRSLKRFMLRTPLKFEPRITSGFSTRRLHPVFRTYRAHLGIDYGAPYGAPVVAVANGTVVSAGWAGGGGRQVRLRHADGYETYYLHLSSFASGIHPGAHVSQGQLIGRVGASGTATGPHLDFRLKKNGVFVNPLREHSRLPPGDPIPDKYRTAFLQTRDHVFAELPATRLASAPKAPLPDAVAAAPR